MRTLFFLVAAVALSASAISPSGASTVSRVSFDAIELRNGGKVILRHGATHQVNFIKGSQDYSSVTQTGDLLTIDKCAKKCPRDYQLEIEIVTPQISRVSVSDGGVIETRGTFPAQGAVAAAVNDGGVVDIRAIGADSVAASVAEGGVIFAKPKGSITAAVNNGGTITYWGNAVVVSAVNGGGVVEKGEAVDADKPLSELSKSQAAAPAVPALPSVPSRPNR